MAEALFVLSTSAVRQRPRDLSLTALSTLATIDRTGPQRLTDLATCEGVTQPSMSALVTQLERLGLASRLPHASDGRVVLVGVTAAGQEYLRAMRDDGAAVFEHMIDAIRPAAAASLVAALPALAALAEAAEQADAPGTAELANRPSPSARRAS